MRVAGGGVDGLEAARGSRPIATGSGVSCATGATPPMEKAGGGTRTASASARRTRALAAERPPQSLGDRSAGRPATSAITGAPPTVNTSDFTMLPSGVPMLAGGVLGAPRGAGERDHLRPRPGLGERRLHPPHRRMSDRVGHPRPPIAEP